LVINCSTQYIGDEIQQLCVGLGQLHQ
jgi:hypothetical protein